MAVKTYRDLDAWAFAMRLVESTYLITKSFPRHEQFGLTAQVRRAAVSVPANIAEGAARRTTNAFANHLSIALGSHAELDTCLEIACRLGYVTESQQQEFLSISHSTGRLVNGLLRALEAKR